MTNSRAKGLRVRPIELRDANAFIALHHRHHKPVVGHRFSLAAYDGERLCGVAVVGRPVARMAGSPLEVAEVTRLCTDGTPNACSILYAAAARAAKAIGFERIQTYTLEDEGGASLRACGWIDEGPAGGGQWNHSGETLGLWGANRRTDQPTGTKRRWTRSLSTEPTPCQ